jgi:hypothetical protein
VWAARPYMLSANWAEFVLRLPRSPRWILKTVFLLPESIFQSIEHKLWIAISPVPASWHQPVQKLRGKGRAKSEQGISTVTNFLQALQAQKV